MQEIIQEIVSINPSVLSIEWTGDSLRCQYTEDAGKMKMKKLLGDLELLLVLENHEPATLFAAG